jgi:hypothetical protein
MADPPLPYPTSNSDPRVRLGRGSTPSTPRWVKVFGMITVIVLVLFGVLHLTGLVGMGGHH